MDLEFCTDGFHSDECPGCGLTVDERDEPANATNAAMNFGEGWEDGRLVALKALREKVAGLIGHQVTGYEWECGTCSYGVLSGINTAPDGSPCPVDAFEDEAISRAAVLAAIDEAMK